MVTKWLDKQLYTVYCLYILIILRFLPEQFTTTGWINSNERHFHFGLVLAESSRICVKVLLDYYHYTFTCTELSWCSLCEKQNKGRQWIKKQTNVCKSIDYSLKVLRSSLMSDKKDVLKKVIWEWTGNFHLAVGSKSLFPPTKLTLFISSWMPCADTFKETHFIVISIFVWSFYYYYRNTFTFFIGPFFFTLFDMLPCQCSSNEKWKQTKISVFSFSP